MRAIYEPSITNHAYQRFRERFWECSDGVARAYILRGIVGTAVCAGATRVLRGDIEVRATEGRVVTVLRRRNRSKGFSGTRRERAA